MDKKATKALILTAGGPRSLANRIGTSRQAVAKWERVPAHWVMLIAELTGVPAEKIRPDVFARRPLKSRAGNGGHRVVA
jgi:DNA-binding transcriptional regulator YdaS (Cro superfamily)